MENNGQGESRLDRIEKMIERQVIANEAAHESFRAEHKLLLTAQVLLQESSAATDLKMRETTEKLDALIKIHDEWIRNNPRGGAPQ